jgi:hypothetical protein
MQQSISDRVNSIDFSLIESYLEEKKSWTSQRIKQAITDYKVFLSDAHESESLSPTNDVDEVWHSHILHTRKYRSDCQQIFGYYLDHTPIQDEQLDTGIKKGGSGTTQSALCIATKSPVLCVATRSKALCIATRSTVKSDCA